MTKLKINIHEAKTHLSKYLKKVQDGQVITLCKNGKPLAKIMPVEKKVEKNQDESSWKYFGIASKYIENIPQNFNEPLNFVDTFP